MGEGSTRIQCTHSLADAQSNLCYDFQGSVSRISGLDGELNGLVYDTAGLLQSRSVSPDLQTRQEHLRKTIHAYLTTYKCTCQSTSFCVCWVLFALFVLQKQLFFYLYFWEDIFAF